MFLKVFSYKWMAILILVLLLSSAIVNVYARDSNTYDAAVSTHPVTDATTLAAEIDGNISIMQVVFANTTGTAATASLYEAADSTTTVSHVQMFSVPANDNAIVNYPGYGEPVLNDFTARASATGIRVFLLYK